LRKIKRVGFDVFLGLEELVNNNRVKVVKPIPPRLVHTLRRESVKGKNYVFPFEI